MRKRGEGVEEAASAFTPTAVGGGPRFKLTMNAGYARRAFGAVFQAVCGDETRPHMNAVLIDVSRAGFEMVATDGHWLAHWEDEHIATIEHVPGKILFRAGAAVEVIALLRKARPESDSISWVVDAEGKGTVAVGQIGAENNFVPFTSIDAMFPDYKNVIPKAGEDRKTDGYVGLSVGMLRNIAAAFDVAWPPEHKPAKKNKNGFNPGAILEFGSELDPVVASSEYVPQLTVVAMPYKLGKSGRRGGPQYGKPRGE